MPNINIDLEYPIGDISYTPYAISEVRHKQTMYTVAKARCLKATIEILEGAEHPYIHYIFDPYECHARPHFVATREEAQAICDEANKEFMTIPFNVGDIVRLIDEPEIKGRVRRIDFDMADIHLVPGIKYDNRRTLCTRYDRFELDQ